MDMHIGIQIKIGSYIILFIYLSGRKTQRNLYSFPIASKIRTGAGQRQNPGIQSMFPIWVAGTQSDEPSTDSQDLH